MSTTVFQEVFKSAMVLKEHLGKWNQVDLLKAATWAPIAPTTRVEYATGEVPTVSPDEQRIASSRTDGYVLAFEPGKAKSTWAHQDGWTSFAPSTFSNDGQWVAYETVSKDPAHGAVYVSNATSGNERWKFASDRLVAAPVFSPDSKSVVFADSHDDGANSSLRVRIINLDNGNAALDARLQGTIQGAPQFSPDGRHVALLTVIDAAHPDATVYILDVTGQNPTTRYTVKGNAPVQFNFSPDGSHVAVTSNGASGSLYLIPLPN